MLKLPQLNMLPERYTDAKVVYNDGVQIFLARDTFNSAFLNNVVIKLTWCNKFSQEEADILKKVSERDTQNCIVQFKDYFYHKLSIGIVMEPLGRNMYELLKENLFEGLHINTVKNMTRQVLTGLAFLEEQGIVHADLKPENVCQSLCGKWFKIIDFGHSSHVLNSSKPILVQSRYYRSPEVLFRHNYSFPIDMWSLGCIVYELLTGAVLFEGDDDVDMLRRIAGYLGLPPIDMLERAARANDNGANKAFVKLDTGAYVPVASSPWPELPTNVLHFLQSIFIWSPDERLTPQIMKLHVFLDY
jgi:serine/threonine protein kinase